MKKLIVWKCSMMKYKPYSTNLLQNVLDENQIFLTEMS